MHGRHWAWILLAAAGGLLLASVCFGWHQLTVLAQWKTADGTLVRRGLMRDHDADGYLLFRIRAAFDYDAGGVKQHSEAVSYFASTSFSEMRNTAVAYSPSSRYPIRFNPARPQEFEFGAGFNALYFGKCIPLLAGAAACFLLFFWVSRRSKLRPQCHGCGKELRGYFQYCPECGEAKSAA